MYHALKRGTIALMRRFFDVLQALLYRFDFLGLALLVGELGTPAKVVPQQFEWIELEDADPKDVVIAKSPLDVN